MTDYQTRVSRPVRWLAAVALGLAVPLFAFILVVLATLPARKPVPAGDLPTLAGVVAFLGGLLVAAVWMLARLVRGTTAGATMMPTWFIQAFGVVFLVGVAWTAFSGQMPLALAGEAALVGVAMMAVARSPRSSDG